MNVSDGGSITYRNDGDHGGDHERLSSSCGLLSLFDLQFCVLDCLSDELAG